MRLARSPFVVADDDGLLDVARDERRIVISGGTDFGALLGAAQFCTQFRESLAQAASEPSRW